MDRRGRSSQVSPFWTDPETVDSFANRDPDRRLVQLLGTYAKPPNVRVLDLGCAGGRNTVVIAGMGFDFQALDASRPMVERTRERVASLRGATAARPRVRVGVMEDLSVFPDSTFDLVVALGVYHQASSLEQWHIAVAESARVLRDGGLVLISAFTPESEPEGKPLAPVPINSAMYEGFSSGPLCLFNADKHDERMGEYGFEPAVPTETVRVKTELGYRMTLNALYRLRSTGTSHG